MSHWIIAFWATTAYTLSTTPAPVPCSVKGPGEHMDYAGNHTSVFDHRKLTNLIGIVDAAPTCRISVIVTYLVDFLISFNSYPRLLVVLVAAVAIRSHFFGRKHF